MSTLALSKTLGPKTARLVTQLYEGGQTVFDVEQAAHILELDHATVSSIIRKAVRRGIFTSVARGVYNLVPFELGDVCSHLDDRYLLVHSVLGNRPYFLSHASALDLHRLTTQPNFRVYASTTYRLRERVIGGNPVHFVEVKPGHFFGVIEHEIAKGQSVKVSDIERTLTDAVRQPEYCGGLVEAAKAFFMAKNKINAARVAEYAARRGIASVVRRAGFLMELYGLADRNIIETMKRSLAPGVVKLDPSLDSEGPYRMDWGLRLNVSSEALLAAAAT